MTPEPLEHIRRVGMDGFAVGLDKGTGVTTYSRNLSFALQSLDYHVDLLYGRRLSHRGADALQEIEFFDTAEREKGLVQRIVERTQKVASNVRATLPMQARAWEVPVNDVVYRDPVNNKLPYYNRIFNSPDLFDKAQRHFRYSGKFLPVHLPDPPDLFHWTYPLPVEIVDCKNVYTLLDLIPLRLPYTTLDQKRYYFKLVSSIARKADLITTISEHSRSDILDLLSPRCDVCNTFTTNTVSDDVMEMAQHELTAALQSSFDLERHGYYLYVGSVEPRKNLKRLVEAYLASASPYPLVIAGPDGWLHTNELVFARLAQLGGFKIRDNDWIPREKIRRLDYLSFRQLGMLFRGARALIMPSLYEGFGLPVLEAMLYGTPVIASGTTSLAEIGGDAVTRVDPLSTGSISDAIKTHDSEQFDIEETGRQLRKDAEQFSPRHHSELLKTAYDTLLR